MDEASAPGDGRLSDALIERYATVVQWGVRVAMTVLVVAYVLYLSGLLPACVPHHQLVQLWSQPHRRLQEATGLSGWSWLGELGHGDMLSLLGIAMLAGLPILALGSILPAVWRGRDRLFAVTVALLMGVLLYAAVGMGSG